MAGYDVHLYFNHPEWVDRLERFYSDGDERTYLWETNIKFNFNTSIENNKNIDELFTILSVGETIIDEMCKSVQRRWIVYAFRQKITGEGLPRTLNIFKYDDQKVLSTQELGGIYNSNEYDLFIYLTHGYPNDSRIRDAENPIIQERNTSHRDGPRDLNFPHTGGGHYKNIKRKSSKKRKKSKLRKKSKKRKKRKKRNRRLSRRSQRTRSKYYVL